MESAILEIINNVGFPIAVSIALFVQMTKTNDKYLDLLRGFKHIVQNNTESIEMLNGTVEQLKDDMNHRVGDKSEIKKS